MLRRRHGLVQFPDHADQTAEPAEHVQRVGDRQHIEERIAHVGGESESLGLELQPGKSLAGNEEQSQEQGDIEPARRICRGFSLLRRP